MSSAFYCAEKKKRGKRRVYDVSKAELTHTSQTAITGEDIDRFDTRGLGADLRFIVVLIHEKKNSMNLIPSPRYIY